MGFILFSAGLSFCWDPFYVSFFFAKENIFTRKMECSSAQGIFMLCFGIFWMKEGWLDFFHSQSSFFV